MLAQPLVSVSGAFCAGKTTLVSALRALRPEFAIVDEGATLSKSRVPEFDWEQPDTRAFLFWFQLVRERAEPVAPLVLCDTSRIDIMAHYALYGMSPPEHWSRLMLRPYDLTLICPYDEVQLVGNGIRDTDAWRRVRLHDLVCSWATDMSRDIQVLSGSPDERVEQALVLIDRLVDAGTEKETPLQ